MTGPRRPGRCDRELHGRRRRQQRACSRLQRGSSTCRPARAGVACAVEFRILGPLEVHARVRCRWRWEASSRARCWPCCCCTPTSRCTSSGWRSRCGARTCRRARSRPCRCTSRGCARRSVTPDVLTTTPAGYRLRVRPDELDAERFARLVEDGRAGAGRGRRRRRRRPCCARRSRCGAGRRWPSSRSSRSRRPRSRAWRSSASPRSRCASRPTSPSGRHAALVGELRQLVAAHPTRERLAGQLMLALYRCGRQADALEAFQAARRRARRGDRRRARAGAAPAAGGDPAPGRLARAAGRGVRAAAGARRRRRAPPLVGRDAELAWLRERWERARAGAGALVALTGRAGSARRRLAAELAGEVHRAGARGRVLRGPRSAGGRSAPRSRARVETLAARRCSSSTMPTRPAPSCARRSRALALAARPCSCWRSRTRALARRADDDARARAARRGGGARDRRPLYAPGGDEDVPADSLLDASDGVPAPRPRGRRPVGAARGGAPRRARSPGGRRRGRAELRSMESELTGDVVELQAARERVATERTTTTRRSCARSRGSRPSTSPTPRTSSGASGSSPSSSPGSSARRCSASSDRRAAASPRSCAPACCPRSRTGVLPGSERLGAGPHPARRAPAARARDATAASATGAACSRSTSSRRRSRPAATSDERAAFVAELATLAQRGGGRRRDRDPRRLLRALRGLPAASPRLLAANHVLVGPMRRDELRRAVECPARARRPARRARARRRAASPTSRAEPGGAAAAVDGAARALAAARRAAPAPRRLRARRRRARRGRAARRGRVRPARRRAARRSRAACVMRLVGLGARRHRRAPPGPARRASRPTRTSRACSRCFTDRRLLTVSAGTVEIAHEALLREWPRLRGWIDEDRDGAADPPRPRVRRARVGAPRPRRGRAVPRRAPGRGAAQWRDARRRR